MITLTDSARSKINELLLENQEPYLRVGVMGGGCSGFQYTFNFEDKINDEEDFVVENVVVDVMSMQYLTGATINYQEDLMGSSFQVSNPNAETTCGCGSSFSA